MRVLILTLLVLVFATAASGADHPVKTFGPIEFYPLSSATKGGPVTYHAVADPIPSHVNPLYGASQWVRITCLRVVLHSQVTFDQTLPVIDHQAGPFLFKWPEGAAECTATFGYGEEGVLSSFTFFVLRPAR